MVRISRRAALLGAGAVATLSAGSGLARAAMGPNDKFDLLIKAPTCSIRARDLRGKRDIGIRYRLIEALAGRHPGRRGRDAHRDRQAGDAGPHRPARHVFPYGSAIGIPADELVAHQARRRSCRRATPAPTTSPPSGASSFRRPGRGCTPSCTSPITASPAFRCPNSTTSTSRRSMRRRAIAENADMVHRRQGAHERERHRQARPRAAEARHPGLRACPERAPR